MNELHSFPILPWVYWALFYGNLSPLWKLYEELLLQLKYSIVANIIEVTEVIVSITETV